MKTIRLVLAALVLGIFQIGLAQDSPADAMISEFKGQPGVTSVLITTDMFNMFGNMIEDQDEAKEFKEVISKVGTINILTAKAGSVKSFDDKVKALKGQYTELMIIEESDSDIRFLAKEKNNRLTELVMVVDELDEDVIIQIKGDFSKEDLSEIGKKVNISGLEHLKKIDDKDKKKSKK